MLVDGEKGRLCIDPRTGVVILDAIRNHRQGGVGMAAEHALALSGMRVADGAVGDFVRKPQPARAHAVEETREAFRLRIELLDLIEQLLARAADEQILADESVELVPMDGQMTLAVVLPNVALIHRHADQVRHQVRQAVIVIALHPDHLNLALGV